MTFNLRCLVFFAALAAAGRAQTVTATVPVGSQPSALAVNPVTNKIYVVNESSFNVTVIDGATNSTTTVSTLSGEGVDTDPDAVAVNPLTNKIYVANLTGESVTVIDGATNETKTVAVGASPGSLAVNTLTNQIYVACQGSVTVIDGATNTVATIATGSGSDLKAVAVNPVTNKIYVTNSGSASVMVIDGATNAMTSVSVGALPGSLAVNPATNKIYVANRAANSVTVIDGATNKTKTIIMNLDPGPVAVNTVTNKVYVMDAFGVTVIDGVTNNWTHVTDRSASSLAVNPVTNQVYVSDAFGATVIDGASNATTTVAVGSGTTVAAINPVTNKIYAANGRDSVAVIDGATYNTSIVPAGANPVAVAVNAATNKIYVANSSSNSVTVIDGTGENVTTVATGMAPGAIAVNPVTNKIYAVNVNSNSVTVIDGATNSTTDVPVGGPYNLSPGTVAINPVTNKIYLGNTNYDNNVVTVIDGATNSTTEVDAGDNALFLAVNPATNKIYVANVDGANSVTVIDGATNSTTTVETGDTAGLAVNPVTNKIYVVNYTNVRVIDGATNTTVSVAAGYNPHAVAVNPVTNKIYVANYDSVTVIDGATNTTATLDVGYDLGLIVVNPTTNKIYVAKSDNGDITVIDGATNTTRTMAGSPSPAAMDVNAVTNKIYVANNLVNGTVSVIEEEQVQSIPLTTSISPLAGNETDNPNPSFAFSALSSMATEPDAVYFQVDTWQNAWTKAAGSSPSFEGALSALQPGFHILYAWAGDGQEATSVQGNSPLTGTRQAYGFLVAPLSQSPTLVSLSPSSGSGAAQTFTGVYADPNGAANIATARLLFNTSSGAANACYAIYYASSNLLYLENDAGTGLTAGITPGSATQVENSQCTLAGAGSSVTVAGNNLTLNAAVTFSASFHAPENVYLFASDLYGNDTGLVVEGEWGSVGAPAVVSFAPSSGSGATQTFTGVYSDPNGIADMGTVRMLFNKPFGEANACYVIYYPGSNTLYLENDGGTGLTSGVMPGSPAQILNSQCTLAGSGSSVSVTGDRLTLKATLTFSGLFFRPVNVYLAVTQNNWPQYTLAWSGWVMSGTWGVSAGGPSAVLLAPSTGSATAQTFTGIYSDPNGAGDIATARLLFNTAVNPANACYVLYYRSNNTLYLENDGGTGMMAGVIPGSAAKVSNSQCTLVGAGSSVTTAGNELTLNAALTFNQSFLAPSRKVYLLATQNEFPQERDAESGWVWKGNWGKSQPPGVVSLAPDTGSGLTQTFTGVYSDPYGKADLNTVRMLLNATESAVNACYVLYYPASNELYLANNGGTSLSAAVTPGSATSVANNQCTLFGTGSSVTVAGNDLTLNIALTFSGNFTGQQNVYLLDQEQGGTNSGWVLEGSWTP